MKTAIRCSLLVAAVGLSTGTVALAQGAPATHGLDGRDFGAAVSGADKSALADHVSSGKSGGAPDTHGLDGRDFGAAVSGADKSELADHVSGGKAGGRD